MSESASEAPPSSYFIPVASSFAFLHSASFILLPPCLVASPSKRHLSHISLPTPSNQEIPCKHPPKEAGVMSTNPFTSVSSDDLSSSGARFHFRIDEMLFVICNCPGNRHVVSQDPSGCSLV